MRAAEFRVNNVRVADDDIFLWPEATGKMASIYEIVKFLSKEGKESIRCLYDLLSYQ